MTDSDAEVVALLSMEADHILHHLDQHTLDPSALELLYKEETHGKDREQVKDAVKEQLEPKLGKLLGLTPKERNETRQILDELDLDEFIHLERLAATTETPLGDIIVMLAQDADDLRIDLTHGRTDMPLDLLLSVEEKTRDRDSVTALLTELIEQEDYTAETIGLERKIASREKTMRTRLIRKLAADGLPEEQLRKATTKDLRQIAAHRDIDDGEERKQPQPIKSTATTQPKTIDEKDTGDEKENDTNTGGTTDDEPGKPGDRETEHDEPVGEKQRLIDKLKQHGLPEEQLQHASVHDLENLLEAQQQEDEDEHGPVNRLDKPRQAIIQEADDDYQFLRRRAEVRDHNHPSASTFEKVKASLLGSDDTSQKQDGWRKELRNLLDTYHRLPTEEAALKTAHIMRRYIQEGVKAERRLTFQEVAEKLPNAPNPHIHRLKDFFREAHRAQYAENAQFKNVDQIIKNCQYVLDRIYFSERE